MMKEYTEQEKKRNTCDELGIAKMEVEYKRHQLKENLEKIGKTLRLMKKTRKVVYSLYYLKLTWQKNIDYETNLRLAEKRLKDFSNLYEIEILKRKLLKNEFKQAQRIFVKKQKRMKAFNDKYFPRKD